MNPNEKHLTADAVAGSGLLHRRALLGRGLAFAGAVGTGAGFSTGAAAEALTEPDWSLVPGDAMPPYQVPSSFEKSVVRLIDNPRSDPVISHARTPHHLLNGIITPNGLHFNVNHGGVPAIDPSQHKLLVHGLVKRPLVFTVEALLRYPIMSRIHFLECGGNSTPLFSNEPVQGTVQQIHGFASCSDWAGVPLAALLDEAGVDPKARWFVAEGADAPHLTRSVPLSKAFDDAIVALYQNGERLMPGNGYPMRLFLPGWEGNMNIKYLRRIKLTEGPALTYHEAHTYTDPLPDGKSFQFYFIQEVKSFITNPSPGMGLRAPGYVEISGVAYSGTDALRRSWSRPMAAPVGGKPRFKNRRCRKPLLASACPGTGAGGPRCCRAVPGTKPATYSRRAPSSLRCAGRPSLRRPGRNFRAITTMPSPAGRLIPRER